MSKASSHLGGARSDARRRARPLLVGAVVLLHLAGCRTWRAVPAPSDPSGAVAPPASYPRVRVVMRDSTQLELRDATVRADSVVGLVGGERRAIARADVARIEARKVSAGRTVGLVGGSLVLVYVTAALIVLAAVLGDWN